MTLSHVVCLAAPPIRASASQDVRIRAEGLAMPAGERVEGPRLPPAHLTLLERRIRHAPAPQQRDPQLFEDHWLVRAVDRVGQTRAEVIIPDPRILRAEFPDATGALHGETLWHETIDFLVPLPQDVRLAELRIYQPRWTGETFALDLIDTVSLRLGLASN